MKPLVVAVLLLVAISAAEKANAQSCGGASGSLTDRGIDVRARDEACDGSSNGPSEYRYERSVRSEPLLCAGYPDALQETIEWYLAGTDVLVASITRCVGAAVPDPALPPPPPSALELFRRAPLPPPEVHVNPRVRGLVGLETWLWWGADTDVPSLRVAAGEWSAAIEVDAARIVWDLGNGEVITADTAGHGPRRPSATYVYETQCDCTITLTAAWTGVVTLTHPLAPAPIVQAVGPVTFTDTFDYEVDEREAVIVG